MGFDPGDPALLEGVHAYEMGKEQGNVLFSCNSVLFNSALQMPVREASWEAASVGSPHASSSVVGTLADCCDMIMHPAISLSPKSALRMLWQ
eukprot:4588393-Amphidinium_carterae.2